jgi:flagellar biosynthesis component FlhA
MAKKKETNGSTVVAKGNQHVAANDEVVTNCGHPLTITPIEDIIITLRGVQVIIDRDLATLYGVETKSLNQAVRRNLNRFPSRYRFQLTKEEVNEVVTNCDHLLSIKYSPTLPYVFTEQ